MSYVYPNLYEDIEYVLDGHFRNRHKTAVAIVHDKIASKLLTCKVIDATSSICDISENQAHHSALIIAAKRRNQVRDDCSMKQKAFRKL